MNAQLVGLLLIALRNNPQGIASILQALDAFGPSLLPHVIPDGKGPFLAYIKAHPQEFIDAVHDAIAVVQKFQGLAQAAAEEFSTPAAS
jgi:hypothetical protein